MATDLKNKFVYQLILIASQSLLPLISYPYITRILGPGNLGRVNYVDSLSQIGIMVAAFGIPLYAIRAIAVVRNDPEKRAKLIKELAVLHICFTLVIAVVFTLLTYAKWHEYPLLYAFALINILLSSVTFEWYLQGMEAFGYAAARTAAVRCLMLLVVFLLIQKSSDFQLYMGIFAGATVLFALINGRKVFADNTFIKQPLQLKKHLKPLWHFFLTSSAISIYIFFDTVILQHITNNAEAVGFYTTVLKLVKICLSALLVIGTVMLPRMSYLAGIGDKVSIARHIDKSLLFIITLGVPICTGLYLLAPEIIQVIAGDAFQPAARLLQVLAFLPIIIGLSNIFAFQILVPFDKEKKFLAAVILGGVLSIVLNLLLVPSLGATGSAMANLITEIAVTIVTGLYAYQLVSFKADVGVLIKTILASSCFIPVILICRMFFKLPLNVMICSMTGCIIVYGLLQLYIFRNEAVKDIFSYLINFLKPSKVPGA